MQGHTSVKGLGAIGEFVWRKLAGGGEKRGGLLARCGQGIQQRSLVVRNPSQGCILHGPFPVDGTMFARVGFGGKRYSPRERENTVGRGVRSCGDAGKPCLIFRNSLRAWPGNSKQKTPGLDFGFGVRVEKKISRSGVCPPPRSPPLGPWVRSF